MKHIWSFTLLIVCVFANASYGADRVVTRFPIPVKEVTDYALAYMKLSSIAVERPVDFSKLDLRRPYVASIIAERGEHYIFVGYVAKGSNPNGRAVQFIMQYCPSEKIYLVEQSGNTLTSSVQENFRGFLRSHGRSAPGLTDVCDAWLSAFTD